MEAPCEGLGTWVFARIWWVMFEKFLDILRIRTTTTCTFFDNYIGERNGVLS